MQRRALVSSRRTTSRSSHPQKKSDLKSAAKHPLVALQQSIGNQALQRLMRSYHIQTKLDVSSPGDPYEQEADRVADSVMRMPSPDRNSPTVSTRTQISRLQRKCAECEKETQRTPVEEEEETLQSKSGAGSTSVLQRACAGCNGAPQDEENEQLQKQALADEQDEILQGKAEGSTSVSAGVQSQVDNLRAGGGQPMPPSVRAYFEPRFGHDFSGVRLHTDAEGSRAARSVNSLAFTVGKDIAFGAGQYSPNTGAGKRLLAHELTHVVQQGGADGQVQRQHVADTGFRYKPPATVKRSIVEIQGVVGSTPDGVYGENTRIAVKKYQTKLKSLGFYTDTLDGKWGDNTETAHVAFATSPTAERRGYNCAGFALKDYTFHGRRATNAIYATMTKLADCSKPCSPHFHKFWMWEVDVRTVNTLTGASSRTSRDFHTVGGQTDKAGNGPDQVMSKNGQRPVEGPKPPLDWEPKSGPALDQGTGLPVPDHEWVISNTTQECFCSDKLP